MIQKDISKNDTGEISTEAVVEEKETAPINLPSAQELLEAGAHFGHRVSAWHPKMEPHIFGARNGIHIFDLEKTVKKLGEAIVFLRDILSRNGVILFVGTKPSAKKVVKEIAQKLNMPYVDGRWLGGTLTNFKTISKRLDYYRTLEQESKTDAWEKYTKKERLQLQRKLEKLDKQFSGIKSLMKPPQAVWASDVKADNIAIREAKKIGIPVVAITDTNMDPAMIDYIIPANDDATSALRKIMEIVAENLLNT